MQAGTVKMWNNERGYGFIRLAGIDPREIFVHLSVVQLAGLQRLEENQRVMVKLTRSNRGDNREVVSRLKIISEERFKSHATIQGFVSYFDEPHGYGFITVEGCRKDFYVSRREIETAGIFPLRRGQCVSFQTSVVQGKVHACSLALAE